MRNVLVVDSDKYNHLHHNTIMPVIIDPEEEKLVTLLLQCIRSSEHKRAALRMGLDVMEADS